MSKDLSEIAEHFPLQSVVDLDFVINQEGWPIGMTRDSPPEFKRRVASAVVSYQLGLASVDYARRKYIHPELFDITNEFTGDRNSDFIKYSLEAIREQVRLIQALHTKTAGQVSAEFTLFRVKDTVSAALLLANRGLLLEVVPICRLALEMIAWAYCANSISNEQKLRSLKAENCFNLFKAEFKASGRLYGLLSKFSHWRFDVHESFLNFESGAVSSISASANYRALSQCICLGILNLYASMAENLTRTALGPTGASSTSDASTKCISSTIKLMEEIHVLTSVNEVGEILSCFTN